MLKCLSLVVLLAACPSEKEDFRKQQPEPEPPAAQAADLPPPPPKKVEAPTDLGKCTLTASGAITAEQTSPGGRAATNVSYWFDEAERKNMMGVDGFVINCQGPEIRFSMVPGGGKVDGMPFTPKRYEFKKGKGDANLMIGFAKASMATPDGVVDITAFDGAHIAGTVDVTGKLTPGGGVVKLTGSFDLACPGFKGCVYDK